MKGRKKTIQEKSRSKNSLKISQKNNPNQKKFKMFLFLLVLYNLIQEKNTFFRKEGGKYFEQFWLKHGRIGSPGQFWVGLLAQWRGVKVFWAQGIKTKHSWVDTTSEKWNEDSKTK